MSGTSFHLRIGTALFQPGEGRLLDPSGQEIHLRAQSSRALAFLADHAGELVSKDRLAKAVWDVPVVTDESISQCIADIRRAIGDTDRSILQTVHKRGYRLTLEPAAPKPFAMSRLLPAAGVLALALVAVIGFNLMPARAPARGPVVAVLPFSDFSPASHRDYLSDAISEGIITNLARYPELTVIARNSSFRFRDRPADIREIAKALGADFVLEGSQQYDGSDLRVTAQLIDAADNAHLWADAVDVPLHDLFEVNARISNRVADAVGTKIIESVAPTRGVGEVSALLLHLHAVSLIHRRLSRETWQQSMALERQAIEEFPDAPWGYIGMAVALRHAVRFGWTDEPKEEVLAQARAYALHAVEIAPDNYMSHFALGRALMQGGDMAGAIKELEKAAELNPASAMVLNALAQPYLYLGDTDEVFRLVRRSEAIDPLHGMVLIWLKAWALWQVGECDRALETIRAISNPPVEAFKLLTVIHACRGDEAKARQVLASYMETNPDWSLARETELNAANWTAEGVLDRWVAELRSAGMPE